MHLQMQRRLLISGPGLGETGPVLPSWAHGDHKGPHGRKEAGRQDSAVRGTPPAVLALKVREGASGQWYALGTLQRSREQILPQSLLEGLLSCQHSDGGPVTPTSGFGPPEPSDKKSELF